MVKNTKISVNDKLMKSFFSLQDTLQLARENINPLSAATLSVESIFDLIIESIDLLRFVRQNQENARLRANLNRGMMEIDASQDNPGGLVPITVRVNPVIPFSQWEKQKLIRLQTDLIFVKRSLLKEGPEVSRKPLRDKNPDEEYKRYMDSVLRRKKSSKANTHFKWVRKQRARKSKK